VSEEACAPALLCRFSGYNFSQEQGLWGFYLLANIID